MKKNAFKMPVLFAALTGLMTALVFAFTMIGITLGTGYINIGDTMIFVTAALFGPASAAIAGGLGALFADLAVYPVTAVFSLFIKAIEGALAGALLRYALPKAIGKSPKTALKIIGDAICCLIAGAVMVAGYFATNVLFWGSGDAPAARLSGAVTQLPWDVLQAVVSVILSNLILNLMRLGDIAAKFKVGKYLSGGKAQPDKKDDVIGDAQDNLGSDAEPIDAVAADAIDTHDLGAVSDMSATDSKDETNQ